MERVKAEEAAGTQTDDDELTDGEFYSPLSEDFDPGSPVRAQSSDLRVRNLSCSLPNPSHPYMSVPFSSSLGSLPNLPRAENPSRYLSPYECHKDIGRKYVGFATLPKQIQRKCMKKGFEFTLMVVGESGLGKSTLVNTFFLTDLYMTRSIPSVAENIAQTVSIAKKTVSIKEKGVKLRLTIVDTPGFGDSIDNRESWKQVSDYIDEQFEQYRRDETSLNRKNLQDNRVHCCLYFISPFGHGLKPLDVESMRALHEKVNIIPVIAKADSLTQDELALKKARILNEIEKYKINIYQIPDADPDEDENLEMKTAVPFAVIGSNSVVDYNGRKIRARVYPWGFVDVENSAHSDFGLLRKMLVMTHMQDLKDTTQDTHYENYRAAVHCKTQCSNKGGSICACAK